MRPGECVYGWVSSDLEQLDQIMELSVDVSAHSDWCSDVPDIALGNQYLLHLKTDKLFSSGLPSRKGSEAVARKAFST